MSSPKFSNAHRTKWFLLLIPVLIAGALTLLVLAYFGTGYLLTRQINTLYVERDCETLLQRMEYVERFYPSRIAYYTDPARGQSAECGVYLKAEALRADRDWEAAYDAYLAYKAAYPKGIYVKEANEFAADSLFEMAAEQRRQHNYAGAVNSLKLLLEKFSTTPAVSKTKAALPEVYLEWGRECRIESEFTEAETVYVSLTAWAEQENDQPRVVRAQAELAQTYFDWGMALESGKDFAQAAVKFDNAIQTDPDPTSMDGIAATTRAHLPGFHRNWGLYLISQRKFAEAIQHYRKSVDLSAPQDVTSAKDSLAQAYLSWAEHLRAREDFTQALERIDDAGKSAPTGSGKKKAEDARADTLRLFSMSRGAQAKELIGNAAASICQNGKPLETLPIVGILEEKRLVVSGITIALPSSIQAQTPGSLYFVACAEEKEVTIQNCPFSRTGYGIVTHWIKRIRYEWQIKVYDALSGKLVNQRTFQGSAPKYCPRTYSFGSSNTAYFRGDKPAVSSVTDWLASLLK